MEEVFVLLTLLCCVLLLVKAGGYLVIEIPRNRELKRTHSREHAVSRKTCQEAIELELAVQAQREADRLKALQDELNEGSARALQST